MLLKSNILGVYVDVISYEKTIKLVLDWLSEANLSGKFISVANVHMIMEANDDMNYKRIINSSNLIIPDGRPLVWFQKLLGFRSAKQVRGPSLMKKLCKVASEEGIPIGLYGSKKETLNKLETNLFHLFPKLNLSYSSSPPFRELNKNEKKEVKDNINNSDAKIVFVGLGCPKQEKWMFNNVVDLNSVLIGVGAAFDFIALEKKEAPHFFQLLGLEWLFRLTMEPRRLFWRYLKTNPSFIFQITKQIFRRKTN